MEIGEILLYIAACTPFAKAFVDMLKKTAIPTPPWSLPFLAMGFGILVAFLLSLARGVEMTLQIAALDSLAGIMSGLGAVAVTELGRSADKPAAKEEV